MEDRDVDEYYKSPKFEEFVHLKQTTQKIIVYSTVHSGDNCVHRQSQFVDDRWLDSGHQVNHMCLATQSQ